MIVDIGAGKTDIAVVSLGGVVESLCIKTAGNAFDEAIVRYIKNKHNVVIGMRTAEELKRSRGNEEAKKYYEYLDTEYKEVTETINSLKKKAREEGMKGNVIGAMEYAEMLRDYTESDIFQRYSQFGSKAKAIERLRDKMMKVDPKTRETIEDAMLELRREMVEEMESAND
jgi:Ethanolamine utilization protein EutJ (predicted chaperonin)